MVDVTLLRRNHAFRALWAAELTRYLAGGLRRVAIPWLVLTLTGSPLQLGIAFALQATPDVLVAPVIGGLIDAVDRRRLLVAGATLAGTAVLVIPAVAWFGYPSVLVVYAVLVALSVFDSLYHNAREAVLPMVVTDDRLDAANAYFSGAAAAVRILFLALGGVSTSLLGVYPTIALAGGVTVLGGGVALFVRVPDRNRQAPEWGDVIGIRATVDHLAEGLAAIRGTIARDVLVTGVIINVAVAPYALLIAAISDRVFAAPVAYGGLLAAVRVGSLAGNATVPRLPVGRTRLYTAGIVLTGLTTAGVAAIGGVVGRVPPVVLGGGLGIALALFGGAMPLFNIPGDSLVQLAADDDTRGRVVTLTNASLQLGFPIGYLGAGWITETWSPFVAFGVAAAVLLLLAAAIGGRLPSDPAEGTALE